MVVTRQRDTIGCAPRLIYLLVLPSLAAVEILSERLEFLPADDVAQHGLFWINSLTKLIEVPNIVTSSF